MRLLKYPFVMIILLGLFLAVMPVSHAQDNTPEPLPTKTPTPMPEANNETSAQPMEPVTLDEPFIQADLSILSGNVQRPNGLFWHNGQVYASCSGDWTIYEINAETGATITYLWGIRNAHTLHAEDDENGDLNLWVPDFQTGSFVRIYQGSIRTIAEQLDGPWGITPIENDFLITSLLRNRLVRVSREGEVTELVNNFRSPTGVALHNDNIYVANNGSSRRAIEWLPISALNSNSAIDAMEDDVVQPLVSGLQSVSGMVVGADNLLYIAYSLGTRGVIGRVNPEQCQEQGGCTNDEVEIVVFTDLAAPLSGLTISPDMTLYIHTIFAPDIYYIKLDEDEESTET